MGGFASIIDALWINISDMGEQFFLSLFKKAKKIIKNEFLHDGNGEKDSQVIIQPHEVRPIIATVSDMNFRSLEKKHEIVNPHEDIPIITDSNIEAKNRDQFSLPSLETSVPIELSPFFAVDEDPTLLIQNLGALSDIEEENNNFFRSNSPVQIHGMHSNNDFRHFASPKKPFHSVPKIGRGLGRNVLHDYQFQESDEDRGPSPISIEPYSTIAEISNVEKERHKVDFDTCGSFHQELQAQSNPTFNQTVMPNFQNIPMTVCNDIKIQLCSFVNGSNIEPNIAAPETKPMKLKSNSINTRVNSPRKLLSREMWEKTGTRPKTAEFKSKSKPKSKQERKISSKSLRLVCGDSEVGNANSLACTTFGEGRCSIFSTNRCKACSAFCNFEGCNDNYGPEGYSMLDRNSDLYRPIISKESEISKSNANTSYAKVGTNILSRLGNDFEKKYKSCNVDKETEDVSDVSIAPYRNVSNAMRDQSLNAKLHSTLDLNVNRSFDNKWTIPVSAQAGEERKPLRVNIPGEKEEHNFCYSNTGNQYISDRTGNRNYDKCPWNNNIEAACSILNKMLFNQSVNMELFVNPLVNEGQYDDEEQGVFDLTATMQSASSDLPMDNSNTLVIGEGVKVSSDQSDIQCDTESDESGMHTSYDMEELSKMNRMCVMGNFELPPDDLDEFWAEIFTSIVENSYQLPTNDIEPYEYSIEIEYDLAECNKLLEVFKFSQCLMVPVEAQYIWFHTDEQISSSEQTTSSAGCLSEETVTYNSSSNCVNEETEIYDSSSGCSSGCLSEEA